MTTLDKRELFGEKKKEVTGAPELFGKREKKEVTSALELFKKGERKVTSAVDLFPPASLETAIPESTLQPTELPPEEVSAFKSIKGALGLTKPQDLPDLIQQQIVSTKAELAETEKGLLADFTRVEPDRELRRRETIRRGTEAIKAERLKGEIKEFEARLPRPGPGGLLSKTELFPLEPKEFEDVIRPKRFMEDTVLQEVSDELQRIVGRGVSGFTGGLSDLAIQAITGKEPDIPITILGTVVGEGAKLAGFLTGPLSLARALIGGRIAISGVTKFRQMADLVAKGGAELGLAGGIADIAPSFMRSESFTEMGLDILKSTALTSIIGGIFPISSLIPTKPLRVATMMAVMDMIRAPKGEFSTVDDVVKGIADGTIEKKELAERSFGYLIDLYFSLKVPSKAKLLKTFESNRLIKEAIDLDVDRVERDVAFLEEKLDASLFEKGEVAAERVPELAKEIIEKAKSEGTIISSGDKKFIAQIAKGLEAASEIGIQKTIKQAKEEGLIQQAVKDTKPIIGIKQVHTAPDGSLTEGPDPEGNTTRTIKTHPADGVLKELAGGQVILSEPQSKDISIVVEYYQSPEFGLRKHPAAQKMAGRTIEGDLSGNFHMYKDITFFNEVKHTISKESQRKATNHLRRLMDGKKGLELTEAEQKAADKMRGWYDSALEDIKIHKRVMYKKYLPENESQAFFEVIKGGDITAAIKKYKIPSEKLLDLVNEYNAIDKYGLDDYITNMERGIYRMLGPDGRMVLTGVTRNDAVEKAIIHLRANPNVKSLKLDTSAPRDIALATELPRGQYFAILGRLGKALESDISFINKEIAKAAAKEGIKGLLVIKPSFKFAGPLVHRKGVLKGEENMFDILPTYSSFIRKKIALDPIIADMRTELPKFPPNVRKLLESQMEYAKGKYSFGDRFLDQMTGELGMKPMLWTRAVQVARRVQGNLKLGYRVVGGLVNFGSGQAHIYNKVGYKYMKEAYKFIGTEEGKKFIREEQEYMGMDVAIDVPGSAYSKVKIHKPLWAFSLPEPINRKTSIAANYLLAKGEMGMTDAAAREYARQGLRFQEFMYNVASLPRMMRSPGGKLVFQFRTYFVMELQYLSQLTGVEILRQTGTFLALAGPRALIYMMRTLPFIGAWLGWDKIEEAMDKQIPRLSRGVPGLLGTDITAPAVIQLPTEPADWGGATLSDLASLKDEVLVPVMEGEDFITDNALEWLKNLMPIMRYWGMLMNSYMDEDGWITDKNNNKVYRVSNWYDKLLLTFGAPPIDLARQKAMLRIIAKEEKILFRNQKKSTIRYLGELMSEGEVDSSFVDDLIRYNVTASMIETRLKLMSLTPEQRALLRAKNPEKLRVFELLNQ